MDSARATSVFNHWATFLAPRRVFFKTSKQATNIFILVYVVDGVGSTQDACWGQDCFFFPSCGTGESNLGLWDKCLYLRSIYSLGQKESPKSHISHSLVPDCPSHMLVPSFGVLAFRCLTIKILLLILHSSCWCFLFNKGNTSLPSAFGNKIKDPLFQLSGLSCFTLCSYFTILRLGCLWSILVSVAYAVLVAYDFILTMTTGTTQ